MALPSSLTRPWHPASWQDKIVRQQPAYPDPRALDDALAQLRTLTPLVTAWEIDGLRTQLAEAARGERFLLMGGECAERFDECEARILTDRLKILLQMSLVLVYGLRKPVVRVGRLAGQYAKPRSSDTETRDGVTLPVFRGDIVNAAGFSVEARTPNPGRLIEAHARSAMTLNYVRALVEGGFADLHHPEYWNLDFVPHSPLAADYQAIVDAIKDAVRFMEMLADVPRGDLNRAALYTGHEALLLPYEAALTREPLHLPGWYNLSTHMPWIGMRTAFEGSAHVEYARGIRNPIGLKVGPELMPDALTRLIDILHPDDEPGRLTLIHRFGADRIADHLPHTIETVRRTGRSVLWCCDPMHGNTERTESGLKTRRFDQILAELEQAFRIHEACGSHLCGVHFEMTGENVTECVGGARGLAEADLEHAYRSQVDPRLNAEQSLEMALRIVHLHKSGA